MNSCRLFLQVYNLSDIVSCDGIEIRRCFTHPTPQVKSGSSLEWPHQPFLSEDNWKLWRLILMKYILHKISWNNKWRLAQPLGPWHPKTGHIHYSYYIHQVTGNLWDIDSKRVYTNRMYQKVFCKQ